MSVYPSLTLDQFNRQVLACQDEAFTLAVALVADQQLACNIVQESFLQVYGNYGNYAHSVAVRVLQTVIFSCRQAMPFKRNSAHEWVPGWNLLERSEQEALMLVDGMGHTYYDATLILLCSERDVARLVASGRYNITLGFH